ncbi:hypothetical protein PC9H_002834 [Pleurotus ostreatus]|uniref:galacturonan 1,4-alpha-galacturonidase n=1 Tax=Pleurotus ostreatus TaxID=5322 RepID=A0A8H6ZXV9_PLEOS|nr:uncharacterized protein PC9H_002834 [Pleurotus ostreatus]KAF7436008.1 hypothetical protein PC9H_002834 [Pleurotus ostreatus]
MLLTTVFSALASYVYIAHAWKVFEVPHVDGQDDTPALAAALANFTADSTILFKKGVTYNIFTPITFPVFTNVEVRIEGNLTYPEDIPTVQAIVGSSSFSGQWFSFSGGTNVTLRGSTDPHWGWVDAHGQAWWDAMEQTNRPHGWAFKKITNGVIRDMKLWKPIAWSFSTSGSTNLHAFNNKIVAVSNSQGFPFNTLFPSRDADIVLILCLGFSAGGTNMLFENNWIQNGDDCITVGNGAKNIHFRNAYCEGGHGLSIGSLGKGGQVADVQNVLIENVVMKSSLYGARFKSWTGGQGLARNITWKDIAFIDVPFPIYITQNYWDQGVGPKPNGTGTLNNTHIQDITFKNFAGTIRDKPYVEGSCVTDPCWYDVPGATGREVAIFDLYPDTAVNVVAQNIVAKTQTGKPVSVMCDPATVENDVGFVCQNGRFVPTTAGLALPF